MSSCGTRFLLNLWASVTSNTSDKFSQIVIVQTEVRQLAEVMGLINKNRKDSQGICFLGKVRQFAYIYVNSQIHKLDKKC